MATLNWNHRQLCPGICTEDEDREKRFDRLLRLIAKREWLAEAARITLASSGSKTPGIDGIDNQRMHCNPDNYLDTHAG